MAVFRKFISVLLIVTALSTAVASSAAASSVFPPAPALRCEDGVCQLAGEASGIAEMLRTGTNQALKELPFEVSEDGALSATLDINKDITLALPIGDVTLSNADLQIEVGPDGEIQRLRGTADMPFPTFGLLDDVRIVTPARAEFGLERGENLQSTGMELAPDRTYLFFDADTAMDVAARTPGNGDDFSISFAPGQRATLAIDTVEPVAYLDGQVTLAGLEQIGLLGGVLENTAVGPYVPSTLPLRERTQFGLSGKFSKEVAESELTLSGAYTLDGGALPARLGIEAQPIRLQGTVSLSRDGVLVDGMVSSAIEPETVFDGGAHIRAFVPFGEDAGPGYAMIDGSVEVPAAKLGAGGGAQIGQEGYMLSGKLTTPLTDGEIAGKVSGELPDVAGAVGPVVEKAADTVGTSVGKAAGAVGSAAGKAAGTVGPAVGSAAGAVGTTVGQAADAVVGTASGAAGLVGPAVGKAAGTVGGAARQGYSLAEVFAESLINAGKARLGRDVTPMPTPTPTPTAP
jgi:hypothetical protein